MDPINKAIDELNAKEVFDAELWGIYLALQLASGSYVGCKEITIFSDS